MNDIKEHDRIVLTADIPAEKLTAGDVGTVVHIYGSGEAYEVEFVTLNGQTVAAITIEQSQIRPIREREITHARHVA